jgi:hypothetical protein
MEITIYAYVAIAITIASAGYTSYVIGVRKGMLGTLDLLQTTKIITIDENSDEIKPVCDC